MYITSVDTLQYPSLAALPRSTRLMIEDKCLEFDSWPCFFFVIQVLMN